MRRRARIAIQASLVVGLLAPATAMAAEHTATATVVAPTRLEGSAPGAGSKWAWDRRERRRTAGMIGGGVGLAVGAVVVGSALGAIAAHCPQGWCDRPGPVVALGVGTATTVGGAAVLATFAGLRATGRFDRRQDPRWAARDDIWSRRMTGFGLIGGLGVAAFAGFAVATPFSICDDDNCEGGSGVVTGAMVGGPLLAVGVAGLAVMGAHRRHHRRSRPGAQSVTFTGTGLAGRF